MNSLSRIPWLLLNVVFGAPLAYTLFHWTACNMQIPLIIIDIVSTYLPFLNSIFNVPYVRIESISSIFVKILFNGFLYAIFGFVHTFFAQESIQNFLRQNFFPSETLRTIYCLLTTITSFIIMGFWQHTDIQLWDLLPSTLNQYQRQIILLCCYHLICLPGLSVVFQFNVFEFCGLKQLFECPYLLSTKSNKRTIGMPKLVTTGLFRYCRHPLYTATILALLITPVMSFDHLMMIIYTCLYMSIGIRYEEEKLVKLFGNDYVQYQKHVPAIVPFTSTTKSKDSF